MEITSPFQLWTTKKTSQESSKFTSSKNSTEKNTSFLSSLSFPSGKKTHLSYETLNDTSCFKKLLPILPIVNSHLRFLYPWLVGGFSPPISNICSSNWIISPNRDEHKTYFKAPASGKLTFLNPKLWRWMIQMTFLFKWVIFSFQPSSFSEL